MKRLVRPNPPLKWDCNEIINKNKITKWYEKILANNGTYISAHWNSEDKDGEGNSIIRRTLLPMTLDCCSYCGKPITRDCEIDHYLPKEPFHFLAYSWYNYLPSCPPCNKAKEDYVPPALKDFHVIDSILIHDSRFHKENHCILDDNLISALEERLFHPVIDDPHEHFYFDVESLRVRAKTIGIGKTTVELLFKKEKRFAKEIARHAKYIRERLESCEDAETLKSKYSAAVGYEFIICYLVDFYKDFFECS